MNIKNSVGKMLSVTLMVFSLVSAIDAENYEKFSGEWFEVYYPKEVKLGESFEFRIKITKIPDDAKMLSANVMEYSEGNVKTLRWGGAPRLVKPDIEEVYNFQFANITGTEVFIAFYLSSDGSWKNKKLNAQTPKIKVIK